ncbi:MAG: hypothetical protein ACI37Q_06820 [Candidatus Gastranaerophilaceae bacterium]
MLEYIKFKVGGFKMESMNKFKVLTVIVICFFVFAVAAIYSNTKDETKGKLQDKNQETLEDVRENMDNRDNEISEDTQSVSDLKTEIDVINKRLDNINKKLEDAESNSLNCRVVGVIDNDDIRQMSVDDAIQEAKDYDKDIVIKCSL